MGKTFMHADLETIKELDLFDGLSPEELDEIVPLIYSMRVIEGERLIRAGGAANNFYISLSGSFMLHAGDGRAITIHDRGDIMGVSSVFGASIHQINATALTDGVVLVIPGGDFQQVIAHHFELGQKIISKINPVVSARQAVLEVPIFPTNDELPAAGE